MCNCTNWAGSLPANPNSSTRDTVFCAMPAPLTHILLVNSARLQWSTGVQNSPLHWETLKDTVLLAAGLHFCLLSQGAAKQFVWKGPRGTHEGDDRCCVGVAKELLKTLLFKTRCSGSPSYRICFETANSACPRKMRGGEWHYRAPADKASHNYGPNLRPVTECYTIHMLLTSRVSPWSKLK